MSTKHEGGGDRPAMPAKGKGNAGTKKTGRKRTGKKGTTSK